MLQSAGIFLPSWAVGTFSTLLVLLLGVLGWMLAYGASSHRESTREMKKDFQAAIQCAKQELGATTDKLEKMINKLIDAHHESMREAQNKFVDFKLFEVIKKDVEDNRSYILNIHKAFDKHLRDHGLTVNDSDSSVSIDVTK